MLEGDLVHVSYSSRFAQKNCNCKYYLLVILVIALLMLIFLRYLVGVLVWLVLIGVSIACLVATIHLWYYDLLPPKKCFKNFL